MFALSYLEIVGSGEIDEHCSFLQKKKKNLFSVGTLNLCF